MSRYNVDPMPRRVEHSFWGRILDSIALCFSGCCHTLGGAFLRVLSTVVLIAGIGGTVMLNVMGYYYLGVLNPHPLIATLLYIPSLAVRACFLSATYYRLQLQSMAEKN